MKEFKLTTKSGESVTKVKAEDKEMATAMFVIIKKLKESDLLKIYNIKEC